MTIEQLVAAMHAALARPTATRRQLARLVGVLLLAGLDDHVIATVLELDVASIRSRVR